MSRVRLVIGLCVLLLVAAACSNGSDSTTTTASNSGLPNPASVYCEEQGGTLEIRTDAQGGQAGYCVFAGGSECEEWAFFNNECTP